MSVRATDLAPPVDALPAAPVAHRARGISVPMPIVQVALIALLLFGAFGVWRRDLSVPLAFSNDTLWYLAQAKSTVDNGWWWWNPRLGAPFGLDALAYPSNSTVDQLCVWLVSRFTSDAIAAVNLTWAVLVMVSGLTATWCMRLLGVPSLGAFVAGTLFAISPYALYRNVDHFGLVIYLVPFACAAALWLASGQSHSRWGKAGRAAVFSGCALLGFNYVYYAFLGSFCILAGTLIGYIAQRDRRILVTGALCIAIIGGATVVNLSPSFYSWQKNGRPLILRDKAPAESEMFGLKIRQLVSPVYPNRVEPLHRWVEKESAARFPNDNENWSTRLGVVATMGFLTLLVLLFMPDTRGLASVPLLRGASRLTLAALLLATVGGFGTLFNLFVSTDIRAYNRISPFIAFFSLLTVTIALERLVARRVRTLTGILVLVVGVGDQGQAAQTLNDRYGSVATELAALSTFVTSLERVLPADAMVLQLPFRTYMSEGDFGRMKQYDHYKPYLVSHQLRFSYPAMSNQQVRWQQAMSRLDARTLAARASAAGFAAILLDRYGYEDGGAALSAALLRVVGEARILASTGRFLVFDISALANEALDVATLEPIPLTLALPPCGREPLMQIDQIGETHGPIPSSGVQLAAGREFKVSGWAVDHPQQAPASGVDVTIDRTVFPTSYGLHRGDVADAYRFASYRETGFSATLPAGVLTAGEHWLSVRVVAAAGTCYYQGRNVRVTVK